MIARILVDTTVSFFFGPPRVKGQSCKLKEQNKFLDHPKW